jgi:Cd2+/Zn2+-exporting ATPase
VFEVARKARLQLQEPHEFHEEAGKGVRAHFHDKMILVGRANWITQEHQDDHLRYLVDQAMDDPEAEGLSTLFVVRNGQFLGWLGLADNTRPQAAGAMDDLREMGLKRLIIVTGDRESVAKRIAGQMHTEYRAEVLPHQKLEMVDGLKGAGHRVAVIGDGVNDAPALKAGDISIAMGAAGSDVAIHSASIALMNNNLNRIPFLIRLSRQTSAVIKQNMAIGGGFILLFLVFAGAGKIPPVVAALLHVVSSLIVVFNSARLVRCGEDIEQQEHQALEASQAKAAPADDDAAGGAAPAMA